MIYDLNIQFIIYYYYKYHILILTNCSRYIIYFIVNYKLYIYIYRCNSQINRMNIIILLTNYKYYFQENKQLTTLNI